MKIYVGNLAYSTSEETLRKTFETFGIVSDAKIVVDRETNRSKGFAFVTMPNDAEAEKAINELDNTELDRRILHVNQARSTESHSPSRSFRGERGPRIFES